MGRQRVPLQYLRQRASLLHHLLAIAPQDFVAYEELVKLRLEDGIDPTHKEDYLTEEEFEKVCLVTPAFSCLACVIARLLKSLLCAALPGMPCRQLQTIAVRQQNWGRDCWLLGVQVCTC